MFKGLYRLRAEGKENLPEEGGYVLAANHTSNLDPWPLGMPLWPKQFLRFMAKSELYWWPLGKLITAGGGFPVRGGERDIEAMKERLDARRQGHVVTMFPEGTRQRKGLVKRHQPKSHTGAGANRARGGRAAACRLRSREPTGSSRLARCRVRYGKPDSAG